MRILLKDFCGEQYVWEDAKFSNGKYVIEQNGVERNIPEANIAAVDGHNMLGYVMCASCGAIIKNTTEEIEKHFVEMEAKRDCLTCNYVTFPHSNQVERQVEKNGDDTYRITETFTSEPVCTSSYSRKKITDPRSKDICKYYACRRNGIKEISDVFSKYPGVFDTVITADALIEKKLKYDRFDGEYFLYDMKSRGTIKACVNKLGIVECFELIYKGTTTYWVYSEKYDKLFWVRDNHYTESSPYWLSDTKYEELNKKIKALYEGAK